MESKERIIYDRENWIVVFLAIIGTGFIAYLGYIWFVFGAFVFIIIMENSNRPDRDIKYKTKQVRKVGGRSK